MMGSCEQEVHKIRDSTNDQFLKDEPALRGSLPSTVRYIVSDPME